MTTARFVGSIISDRQLWLDGKKETVLEDGDARAAFLLVAAGGTIAAPEVTRLRLTIVDGQVVQVAK